MCEWLAAFWGCTIKIVVFIVEGVVNSLKRMAAIINSSVQSEYLLLISRPVCVRWTFLSLRGCAEKSNQVIVAHLLAAIYLRIL